MPLSKRAIKKFVAEALREDAAFCDITTLDFIPEGIKAQAEIIAKEDGVICGMDIAREVFKAFDRSIRFKILKKEGQRIKKGDVVASLSGWARSILSPERVALNFLSYLSGISSQTYQAVSKVQKKGIRILDTRKTTPLLRAFEKYAVSIGQGKNHRFDLFDQYLVKDNHLAILRQSVGFEALAERLRKVPFEIEVGHPKELKEALSCCPDIVMLDNFSPQEIKKAIVLIQKIFPDKNKRPLIELSGGITIKNISRYAIRGVDFISLGALTHSARALDMSLEIVKCL